MVNLSSLLLRSVLSASAFALLVAGNAAWADPPGRVARMSYIRGDVGFQPGGSGEWADAVINRPLVTGDRLATDRDARVELEIGAGSIRLDERSTFSLLNIDDRITQVELTDGTLNINVRRLLDGQTYEVDTPTLAFVVSEPGEYRIDVAPDGDSTIVTVFDGSGDVYGENNASYRVRDGNSYQFNDSRLRDYEVLDIPRADDFDRFCEQRARRYERAVSSRYVSDEIVGYADLDDYGSWSTVADYGSVWYPRGLRSDWAPYRDGHWAWIDPWGWSWVDDQPWGFAPSHYGRWANINNRWGWVPGPRTVRPVYAPALVAFVGGSNWSVSIGSNPVGWFPLGPRDVYRPWYPVSRDYFTRVNTRNTVINNVTVVNIYNDYSRGRPSRGDYAYRRDQRAFTAVPGNVFAGARSVGGSRLRLNQDVIGRGDVINVVGVTPVAASLARRGNGRAHRPNAERFDRRVVARNAPPAQVLPFAQREAIIRDNGNRSPGMDKLRGRDRNETARAERRVRVVDADNRAKPQDIPAGRRGDANRAGRGDDNRAGAAGRDEAREQRQRLRGDADGRRGDASADKSDGMPSTRFSPEMRNRANADDKRAEAEQRREARSEKREDNRRNGLSERDDGDDTSTGETRGGDARMKQREAQDQRNRDVQERRQAEDRSLNDESRERNQAQREQQRQAVEERARRNAPDAIDPPERFRPDADAERKQRERGADVERQNQRGAERNAQRDVERQQREAMQEQRRAQAEQQREQQSEGIEMARQQRNRQVERAQAQQEQQAEQANRNEARQMAREQQQQEREARMQAQEQQRAEQVNRNEAQQMQREQQQQQRQAQMQQQQEQMQQRQQQAQERQMQEQAQMQQRQQQVQQQQQQQQEAQQQAQPQQDQREQRKQRKQRRQDREEKEDKQDKQDR